MARRDLEEWLSQAVADEEEASSRRRFHSLYLDMLEVCQAEHGRVSNLHVLAAYVVWMRTPKRLRVPVTQIELAHILGYTKDDIFRKWRERYPDLFSDESIRDAVKEMVIDRLADVVDASLDCAINGGEKGFQDRKLVLEIAGVVKSGKTQVELTGKEGGDIQLEVVDYRRGLSALAPEQDS